MFVWAVAREGAAASASTARMDVNAWDFMVVKTIGSSPRRIRAGRTPAALDGRNP
jgi:hypothetical protein